MAVPVEYTVTRNRLSDFRNTVLTDLVGGRVKAGLNASHDSMGKYSKVVQQLSVTPNLFGSVNGKALALQLKGLGLGNGQLSKVGLRYTSGQVNYPLQPPYNVPVRKLPQVDVFKYTLVDDVEALEKTNITGLSSLILIQVDSGTFEDVADAENSIYDYYQYTPLRKDTGSWIINDPQHMFTTYNTIRGECYVCGIQLVKKGTTLKQMFLVWLWISPTVYNSAGDSKTLPAIVWLTADLGCEPITANIAGRTLKLDTIIAVPIKPPSYAFVYDPMWGHNTTTCGTNFTLGSDYQQGVWCNNFDATVQVNDEDLGETDPPSGTVTKIDAFQFFHATATPKDGCVFDYWLRNGIVYEYNSSLSSYMMRDSVFVAHFSKA